MPECDPDNLCTGDLGAFHSDVVDRVRAAGNTWQLPGGQIVLPREFGFCRGVERALTMLDRAVRRHAADGKRIFLLGQIIHNPWVNRYFESRGVRILSQAERDTLEQHATSADCAVIPAFGVPLPIEQRLRAIGCEVVDTSCGDVRRLWVWAEREVRAGFGIVIFGRATHDETVVTTSRLAAAGGKYLVLGTLGEVRRFADMLAAPELTAEFSGAFGRQATNSASIEPFERLAQVSQTTMLYDDTMAVRSILSEAFARRFGPQAGPRLMLQPTVCRATQDRQAAAVELCREPLDLAVVVGGFGSSNTRHLYELARSRTQALFIEDADSIVSSRDLRTMDLATERPVTVCDWLPSRRPLRIGVLAGALSPEVVVGQVLQKLGEFLGSPA